MGTGPALSLSRYLTRLIWLCVLPLTLLATFLAFNHVRHMQLELDAEARHLVGNVADAVDHELTARIGALGILAGSALADDPTRWGELYSEARVLQENFGLHVAFVDADAQMRFNTRLPYGSELPPLHPSSRRAVQQAAAGGKPAVGDLFHGLLIAEPMAPLAVPGLRQGRATHVVVGGIESRHLRSRLEEFSLPAGWTIVLLDSAGTVLTRHPAPEAPARVDDEAARRFGATTVAAPWRVALTIPARVYRAPLLLAGAALALAIAGVTLAAVLGGSLAARRLAASVRSLASAPGDPADGVRIIEVDAVRHVLAESTQRRDQAEAARREVEQRYRERLEHSARALELSQARLHGIFESATQAILTTDESQVIVMANPAAAQLFRCPLPSLIGAPLEQFIPERFRAHHRLDMQAFGELPQASRHMGQRPIVTGLRADGEEFPIDAGISHLEVGGQRLFTVILRDITPRLRAEQALRASEARLRRLLMLLPVAVFVGDGRQIGFVNEEAQRLLGVDMTALLGRSLLDFIDPASQPVARERMAALLAGAPAVPLQDLRIRRADGSLREVESVGTMFSDGAAPSVIVLMRDVTALRRVQAALAESHADLRRLVTAQDRVQEEERKRIARELHDDLQQTLAAIRIDLGATSAQVSSEPAAAVLREVDALAAAAIVSLRRIVNDLRPKMLEDLGLVPALESLCSQFAQRSGIECRFEAEGLDDDAQGVAPAVATCLYRIAQEALNNVARHARARCVRVRLGVQGAAGTGLLTLTVDDDGRGIAIADRRKPDGYGLLGMRERVTALGGEFILRSEDGAGTAIQARIPVSGGAAVAGGS